MFSKRGQKVFHFDEVFTQHNTNDDIFCKSFSEITENVIKGFNSTVFAYGMTGAGKTHTMFGEIYQSGKSGFVQYEQGLILHIVKNLFQRFEELS